MLTACETDLAELVNQIDELRDMDETVKQRKKDMKKSIDLLDNILKDGHISDTHLRMLVEEIKIFQTDGKLRVVITLNGAFRTHFDYYDEIGEMIRREAELWYEQVSGGDWIPMGNEDE
jgi:predicted site-specific integrase-resolvase